MNSTAYLKPEECEELIALELARKDISKRRTKIMNRAKKRRHRDERPHQDEGENP